MATTLNQYAKDPTLGEMLWIKSTTSGFARFFIEAIFSLLDDVGVLWNPSTIDHMIHDCLKLDPFADLEAKVMQLAN